MTTRSYKCELRMNAGNVRNNRPLGIMHYSCEPLVDNDVMFDSQIFTVCAKVLLPSGSDRGDMILYVAPSGLSD